MSEHRHSGALAGPGWMFFSTILFGYFGFFMGLTANSTSGAFVFFFAALLWTLRISAIGFLASALVTFVQPLFGNLLYSVVGLLSAAGLLLVGVMDIVDAQNSAALPPVLAFLFAGLNGYTSWAGLQAVKAIKSMEAAADHVYDGS